MPVTQRQYDLMQLRAQIHVGRIVEEWRKQFLGGRLQTPPAQAPQPVDEQAFNQPPQGGPPVGGTY